MLNPEECLLARICINNLLGGWEHKFTTHLLCDFVSVGIFVAATTN